MMKLKLKAKPRVECCQHGHFIAVENDLHRECICSTCAHKWTVCLKPDGKEI